MASVVVEGPLARAPDVRGALDAGAAGRAPDRGPAAVDEGGLEGKSDRELAALGADAIPLAHLLEGDGRAGAESPGSGGSAPRPWPASSGRSGEWFAINGELTPQSFKELTGLTRKGAIPLLEWLDRKKLTRRDGDQRVPGPVFSGMMAR